MEKASFSKFLKQLTAIAPRRGISEQIAATLIKKYLEDSMILFQIQTFEAQIPLTIKAKLTVDGKNIPCLGASFVSGKITNTAKILNSFDANSDGPIVMFNPVSLGICLQGYKNIPAVAVNRDSVVDLEMGNDISGEVIVEKQKFISQNILVGNTKNPSKIIFAHYDSIVGSGAVDNAAAVDIIFQTIVQNSNLLAKNLFVFAGCEEESISSPEGFHGFSMLDQEFPELMNIAQEIIVLDGVGISTPHIVNDHLDWVFGIPRLQDLCAKIYWMKNDQSEVMKYYHTTLDTLNNLKQEYIEQAKEQLVSRLEV